jgi:hypothetical protein
MRLLRLLMRSFELRLAAMPLGFSSQHADLAACARAEARTEILT